MTFQAEDGSTALIRCACYSGNTMLAKYLLDSNANVNLGNSMGTTPLICAAMNGFLEVIL